MAETWDADARVPDGDAAFVVGALSFLGRIDEAQACFDAWRLSPGSRDPRTREASRFFLGVAYARAGDFDRSRALLVGEARARVREVDAWGRAFVFQGLAVHRYFTGRYRAAARHGLRALRAAHEARLPYAQMLSTDLRGHALVQVGQYFAGVALLEQAKALAERLGFEPNAYAIACSMVVYAARFRLSAQCVSDLEALLAGKAHDSYSRRALLTELAVQRAVRGRATEARAALEEAERDALRSDARRAKATSILARLHLARWGEGVGACDDLVERARPLLDAGDVAFRAELHGFDAFVARANGDAAREARARAALRELAAEKEHYIAKAALEQLEGGARRAFAEDEVAPLLHAVVAHEERALSRLLASGMLGPVPELLGLEPGRRVILLPNDNAAVIEDRGDLWLRPHPPRWAPRLLALLASGDASKEAIVRALWGLRFYRAERHDPLVRTTIHRLRAFLEPRGEWVVVTPTGYALSVPVHVAGTIEDPADSPPEDVEALDAWADDSGVSVDDRVADRLAALGAASVRQLARALKLSESTVLRALRRLVKARRAARTGAARATRYRIVRPTPAV